MNKVLIVDDEYLVRLGLRTSFHWALHGFEIVGEASNGEEAIRVFEKTDPDILLTDIKMPGMDGIRLIEILKARKPELYVVILSNHDDFSYARRAIQFGASQYILKSELQEETILSVLNQASSSIDSEPEKRRRNGRLEQCIRKSLFASNPQPPDIPRDALEQLEQGDYVALSCRCNTAILPDEAQGSFHKACLSMLQEAVASAHIVSAEVDSRLRILLLCKVENCIQAEELKEHVHLIISNLRQYYDIEFRVGISSIRPSIELKRLISEAHSALDMCFFSSANYHCWTDIQPAQTTIRLDYRQIIKHIDARDWGSLKQEIESIFNQIRSCCSMHAAKSCYIDLLSLARQTAYANISLGEAFICEKKIEYQTYYHFDHIDEMKVYIEDIFRSMLNLLSGRGKRYSSIVTRCITYIQNNYSRTISLSEAAEDACVSKSYLSILFKQETGINFSKYLMDYRIDRAKQLLSQSSMRIYEIAEQVGFPNPYYFSKVFKEYTGKSCKEFRNNEPGL